MKKNDVAATTADVSMLQFAQLYADACRNGWTIAQLASHLGWPESRIQGRLVSLRRKVGKENVPSLARKPSGRSGGVASADILSIFRDVA